MVDRHLLSEAVLGQHIAADMLRQVAREGEQLSDEPLQPRDVVLFGVEARFDETFDRHFAAPAAPGRVSEPLRDVRSEEHTSELQSLMRISYAVFCLKKKKYNKQVDQDTLI